MHSSFTNLCEQIQHASGPQDIFGPVADPLALKRRYHQLAALIHPDRHPDQAAVATEAFMLLQYWYTVARSSITTINVVTPMGRYVGYTPPIHGDLSDLFACDMAGKQVLLKIVRNPRNTDLLEAEARVLRQIEQAMHNQPLRAHFPTLVETFRLRDAAGVQRHTNVLCAETGYVSLADVMLAYPQGVHAADAAWMFNRLLAALATVHNLGLVHGAVVPSHVLIRPSDHNGMLIDWCYTTACGDLLKAVSPPYAADYPPEVEARQPVTPATDLYMAALCMVRLLGGNPTTGYLPASVPRSIQALLRTCLLPAPARRANNAWDLFEDFQAILRTLYGPPRFRPFRMPI